MAKPLIDMLASVVSSSPMLVAKSLVEVVGIGSVEFAKVGGKANQYVGEGVVDDAEAGGEAPHRRLGIGIIDDSEVCGETPR